MPTFHDVHSVWERHPRIIQLGEQSKKPVGEWNDSPKTLGYIATIWGWREKIRYNYGIVMGKELVGVDADNIENARELFRLLPKTPWMVKTHNGVHFYFHAPDEEIGPKVKTRVMGIECDIRAGMSYLVGPGSVHPNGSLYELVYPMEEINLDDMPTFDPSWIEDAPKSSQSFPSGRVKDGVKYIARITAVAGQGGHNATFRAACKLRDSGLSETEALAAMIEWNKTNAEPPWETKDLLHKVKSAFQKETA